MPEMKDEKETPYPSLAMIYDEEELRKSIEVGERRLAAIKQQKRRRARWMTSWLILAAVVIPVGVAAFIASKRVPSTPHFVVTWPKLKTQQSIESGQIVLSREGQPFEVSISEAPKWNVAWTSNHSESSGESFSWAPQQSGELLQAKCRAKNTDWTAYFSAVVPQRDLSLGSIAPDVNEGYGRTVSLGQRSAWVFPHIQAAGDVSWDERALPALSAAADAVPSAALAERLEAVTEKPAPALWQVVSDFDSKVNAPATDGGTYVSLHASGLDTLMPKVGARLVQLLPDASIKWVLRFDKDAPEGIVRVSFDGKRERRAWVKRSGNAAGTPITGWEKGDWQGTIPLELPTSAPSPQQ